MDRAAQQQQMLGQRGLARVGMGNDREGAPSARLRWRGSGSWRAGLAGPAPPAATGTHRQDGCLPSPAGPADTSPARAAENSSAVKTMETSVTSATLRCSACGFQPDSPARMPSRNSDQHAPAPSSPPGRRVAIKVPSSGWTCDGHGACPITSRRPRPARRQHQPDEVQRPVAAAGGGAAPAAPAPR